MIPLIFLTGSNGFIGNQIFKYFNNKGFEIIKLPSKDLKVNNNNSNNYIKEIKSIGLNNKETYFIHCASATPKNSKNKLTLWKDNLDLTLSISEFIISNKIQNVINLSSVDSYGVIEKKKSPNFESLSENIFFDKFTTYGASKLASETILNLLSEKYRFKVCNLRLPGVVGVNSIINPSNFISKVTKQLMENKKIKIRNRGFYFNNVVHIDTLCKCIEFIFKLENNYINKKNLINIASKNPVRIDHLINILKERLFSKSKIEYIDGNNTPFQISIKYAELLDFPLISTEETIELFLDSLKKR